MQRVLILLALGVSVLAGSAGAVTDVHIDIEKPGPRQFVVDLAGMIKPQDQERIQALGDKLLTDKAIPIIVVTIESMAQRGGKMRIETFARLLFDQWELGIRRLGEQDWNRGILLLVSRDDRVARIELGAGWKRDKDAQAEAIMRDYIVSRFKAGDFSGGIVGGVEALDKLARDEALPRKPIPTRMIILFVVVGAVAAFTVVSLIRRGSSGWAWLAWGAVFAVVGFILYQMATSRGRSSGGGGGGGYSGGSFGGGFSGGGGATGSW